MPSLTPSTAVTITNPLVLYRAYLATKRIDPDPGQHRLALHLQKLYQRLKDYQPDVDYRQRLDHLFKVVAKPNTHHIDREHEIQHTNGAQANVLSSLQWQKEKATVTALTKTLTDHESALRLHSPQGLLLYGEVGTGKSVLIDLLADCLPTRKKKRWHFNTFMLETFAKLEEFRKNGSLGSEFSAARGEEHSLLWLAREMISTSPILFLDEFQLPDKAASKILSNLFISFFHLGGVLIATSNRMPEELANASGAEFTAAPTPGRGRFSKMFGSLADRNRVSRSASTRGDFAAFLEVLRARCEIWEMEGSKDWRRRETQEVSQFQPGSQARTSGSPVSRTRDPRPTAASALGTAMKGMELEESGDPKPPPYYFLSSAIQSEEPTLVGVTGSWKAAELRSIYGSTGPLMPSTHIPWDATTLRVYGRNLSVSSHLKGVTKWNCKLPANTKHISFIFYDPSQHS